MIPEKKISLNIFLCSLVLAMTPAYSIEAFGKPWWDEPYIDAEQDISVIITFSDKVDLREFEKEPKKPRRKKIIKALKQNADTSQEHVRRFLSTKKTAKLRQLWLINSMAVRAKADVIRKLAARRDIVEIRPDFTLHLPQTQYALAEEAEWNLNMVAAGDLWDLGFAGEGIVVASMDNGVDVNHPDLNWRYRGGANSWYDPRSEYDSPYDPTGHGTHTMGVMVGGNYGGTYIGVAPGAEWISAKIFNDAGTATASEIHLGFQWLLDPDNDANTDDAPDIVNNSWGLPDDVNECLLEFYDDVQALRTAGIAVVFAAGNAGPASNTSISPANYDNSFAVGSLDSTKTIDSTSGRGPSSCYGDIYPHVTAPGVNVRVADLTFGGIMPDSFDYRSGTSLAAPHVSGTMALLMEAFPDANVPQIEWALQTAAEDLGVEGPDNDYGYGLIDVLKAYELISVDLNRDQHIDFTDFSLLGDQWLENGCGPADWCGRADTDRNSEVGLSDMLRLSIYWLE